MACVSNFTVVLTVACFIMVVFSLNTPTKYKSNQVVTTKPFNQFGNLFGNTVVESNYPKPVVKVGKVISTAKTITPTSSMLTYTPKTYPTTWNSAEMFNSTTIKTIISIQNNVTSALTKVENTILTWITIILSKIDRDLRLTTSTGSYIKKRAVKDTARLVKGIDKSIIRPIYSLPETVATVTKDQSQWEMLKRGINPTESPKLLSNFQATTTKQRANSLILSSVKEKNPLAPDALYNTVRTLPSQLKYDYDRRVVSRELAKNVKKEETIEKRLSASTEVTDEKTYQLKETSDLKIVVESTETVVASIDTSATREIFESARANEFDTSIFSVYNIKRIKDELSWVIKEVAVVEMLNYLEQKQKQSAGGGSVDPEIVSRLEDAKKNLRILSSASNACDRLIILSKNGTKLEISDEALLRGFEVLSGYSDKLANRIADNKAMYELISQSIVVLSSGNPQIISSVDNIPAIEKPLIVQKESEISENARQTLPVNEVVEKREYEADVFIETTAESFDATEVQIASRLLTTLDVALFLVETAAKGVGAFFRDRGAVAIERINQAYCVDEKLAITKTKLKRAVSLVLYRDSGTSRIESPWRLLKQLTKRKPQANSV